MGRKNRAKFLTITFSILWILSAPLAKVCAAELPVDIKNILLKITSSIVDKDFGSFQVDDSEGNSLPGDAESRLSPLAVSPIQMYFPLSNNDIKNYQGVILGATYYATYSYSQVFYNGRTCYLERDSADGSQTYYGYSGGQLQMYGATVDSESFSFDTPLNILNDSMLNDGGSLQSSTTLTVQGTPVTVHLTVFSTLVGSVTIPLGKADNCRSIDMTFSYSIPGESETIEIRDVWILAPNIGKLRIAVMDQFLNQRGWLNISGGAVGGKSVGEILNPQITYTLSTSKAGTGTGTINSTPSGINCGSSCSASYTSGTNVTLTATPGSGSTFAGWSGSGCSGTGTCSLIINKNIQVTALFANPWGDVNNDGKIDLIDVILSLQVLSNMDTTGKTITIAADANNDSKIGLAEAVYILQKVAGWRDHSISSCYDNLSCPNGSFCEKEIGNCAGAGVCSPMGGVCTTDYNPVCGCNGMTYSNACSALGSGVTVAYMGICN